MKVILILGCKVIKEGNNYLPSKTLKNRLIRGFKVFKEETKKGNKVVIICSGGDNPGRGATEAQIMKDFLLNKGVLEKYIFCENRSYNTIENIIFTKFMLEHFKMIIESPTYGGCIPLERNYVNYSGEEENSIILEPIKELILVTSDFHMNRSLYICKTFINDIKIVGKTSGTSDDELMKRLENEFKINVKKCVKHAKIVNWRQILEER